jgi:MFS family permease
MASGGQSLSFATVSDIAPEELRATAIGANNSMINLFGAIFPPLVTWIMQEHRTEQIYTQSDFTLGFLVMPIAYGIAFLIALVGIRETYCRAQQTVHFLG